MDLGRKGVFWFTDSMTSAQGSNWRSALKSLVTPSCGIRRRWATNLSAWAVSCSPIQIN
jgi:hypothetical protein